jgi:hypothetical protein
VLDLIDRVDDEADDHVIDPAVEKAAEPDRRDVRAVKRLYIEVKRSCVAGKNGLKRIA